jgi:hypothetical protein
MTLYLCDNSVPWRDSGLENLIVIHEYTHGLSHRLAEFGPYHSQSGGLQDGLCDFMGLAITSEPDDDLTLSYPRAQWYYDNPRGNRRQPYSTDQTVFTRTYGQLWSADDAVCALRVCTNHPTIYCDADADCPTGDTCHRSISCIDDSDCRSPNTVIDQRPCAEKPWPAGEIWCNTLWNARANLVWKHGFDTGGQTILQLAVDGLKGSPDHPDYLDMRDHILQADRSNNGGANQCVLWNAFARMGMGFSSGTTGEYDIYPVEAFNVPPDCMADIQVDSDLAFDNACVGGSTTKHL